MQEFLAMAAAMLMLAIGGGIGHQDATLPVEPEPEVVITRF